MSADGTLPNGVRHDDVSDRPRPWLDSDEPHHAGDDDEDLGVTADGQPPCESVKLARSHKAARNPRLITGLNLEAGSTPATSTVALEPDEPERFACRQCGKPWDEPRLSPDGVCPLCQADLEER